MNYPILADKLKKGETIQFRPRGNSMKPKIKSGEQITVEPISSPLNVGDIVFCKVRGSYYVHLIKAIKDESYLIGNNHGKVNGWTKSIFGKVTAIEP